MSSPYNGVSEQDIRTTSTTQGGVNLGAIQGTPDGRTYRYGLAGATALDPGKVMTTPAIVTNHVNRPVTVAAAIGSFEVQLTLGATAATQDQYKDGYLTINDGTGEGILYRVEGNSAAASSGTLVVTLTDPLKVALVATTSEATPQVNPYSGLIVSASAVALQAAGVPNVTIAAGSYGWIQTGGYCAVLSDGVIGKGSGAIISDAVAGAAEVEVAGTVTQRLGWAPEATVDTEYRTLNLTLARA